MHVNIAIQYHFLFICLYGFILINGTYFVEMT